MSVYIYYVYIYIQTHACIFMKNMLFIYLIYKHNIFFIIVDVINHDLSFDGWHTHTHTHIYINIYLLYLFTLYIYTKYRTTVYNTIYKYKYE